MKTQGYWFTQREFLVNDMGYIEMRDLVSCRNGEIWAESVDLDMAKASKDLNISPENMKMAEIKTDDMGMVTAIVINAAGVKQLMVNISDRWLIEEGQIDTITAIGKIKEYMANPGAADSPNKGLLAWKIHQLMDHDINRYQYNSDPANSIDMLDWLKDDQEIILVEEFTISE